MDQEVRKAAAETAKALGEGKVVLYPTDTVWGLGCDPFSKTAIEKLREIKGREENKPFILLVRELNDLYHYATTVPDQAIELAEVSDRPVTLVLHAAPGLSAEILSADGYVAMRVPRDKFCRALLKIWKKPVVSTSANFSGEKTPVNFPEISEKVKDRVDHIVPLRDSGSSKPSVVIRFDRDGSFRILRK